MLRTPTQEVISEDIVYVAAAELRMEAIRLMCCRHDGLEEDDLMVELGAITPESEKLLDNDFYLENTKVCRPPIAQPTVRTVGSSILGFVLGVGARSSAIRSSHPTTRELSSRSQRQLR
jgi:hypothetical protein